MRTRNRSSGWFELWNHYLKLGSKDASRKAFEVGLVEDGAVWLDMIKSWNLSSHTYNEDAATEVVTAIIERYYGAFCDLHAKLKTLAERELNR